MSLSADILCASPLRYLDPSLRLGSRPWKGSEIADSAKKESRAATRVVPVPRHLRAAHASISPQSLTYRLRPHQILPVSLEHPELLDTTRFSGDPQISQEYYWN